MIRMLLTGALAVAAIAGYAQNAKVEPVESMSVSKVEARTKNPKREPGIFGDYWWANLSVWQTVLSLIPHNNHIMIIS